MVWFGAGVTDGCPERAGRSVEFVEGAPVSGHAGQDGGGVTEADGTAGADVDDALRGGEAGGVDGASDVADIDEVPLGAQTAELEFAVTGLHGAAHGLGEAAERGSRGGAGPRR